MSVLQTTEYRKKAAPDTGKNRFGRVLHRLREAGGWSLRDLAKMADVPASSLSHYEKGLQMPRRDVLQRLGDGMGVPADLLIWLTFPEPVAGKDSPAFVKDVERIMMEQVDVFVQALREKKEEQQ
jgi:transcriptional regulator with XRE-family HTH domain